MTSYRGKHIRYAKSERVRHDREFGDMLDALVAKFSPTASAKTVSDVDTDNDQMTATSHSMYDGQPVKVESTISNPTGVSAGTIYFFDRVGPAIFALNTKADLSGATVVISTVGSGTITIKRAADDRASILEWLRTFPRTELDKYADIDNLPEA